MREASRRGVGAFVNCLKTLTRFLRVVYKVLSSDAFKFPFVNGKGSSEMEMTVLSSVRRSQFQTRFASGISRLLSTSSL